MTKAQPQRRKAKQARAQATIDAIFEATAQILEADGEARLTTNRIAETAGVSIGSLYQYFADKQAILVAMAHRENARVREEVKAALAGEPPISPARLLIRTQIAIMKDRPATRRAALKAILDAESARAIAQEGKVTSALLPAEATPTGLDGFVLSRAIVWAIRAAVLEERAFLHDQAFEDALVRLAERYGA
jgi:AcrR family transcriptional regulator